MSMTGEANLFLRQIYHHYSLDWMYYLGFRIYPGEPIHPLPEQPLELPPESPEYSDHLDRTLAPYPLLQKPAESKPVL